MKRLVLLLSVIILFYACNPTDHVNENGNLILNNNSSSDVFFEIYSDNDYIVGDTLKSDTIQTYNIPGGVKRLMVYDDNGGLSLKNFMVFPKQNNDISVVSVRSIVITNNRDIPVYFHSQRYYEDKRPVVEHWSTFTENNQPRLIKSKESIKVTLIDGYKYWGSITMDRSDLPGKNKVLFRVNKKLSPVIL